MLCLTMMISLLLSRSNVFVHSFLVVERASIQGCRRQFPRNTSIALHANRRQILLAGIATSTALLPQAAMAGPVGARINQAVTTSDLGVSVRTSVVKGAQTMDQLDRSWEDFSDRFQLGSARTQAGKRPKPKVIPPLETLDQEIASQIIQSCDSAFLMASKVSESILKKQVNQVATLVRPSFERTGLELGDIASFQVATASQFNFWSYVHFKAYNDILIENKIDFKSFRRTFETESGRRLLSLLDPQDMTRQSDLTLSTSNNAPNLKQALERKLENVETILRRMKAKGLVADIELSPLDQDRVADWVDDLSDLQFSLAVDGDSSMNAQILLQEQGFNVVPSYCKYVAQSLLQIPGERLTIDEYYMDTDYNSNPDLFEVKEVLLNIVLESNR